MKKINSRQATHDDELPNAQVKYVYSKRDENDALQLWYVLWWKFSDGSSGLNYLNNLVPYGFFIQMTILFCQPLQTFKDTKKCSSEHH